MRIPGAEKAMRNIIQWASRGQWIGECNDILADHTAKVYDAFDIAPGELKQELGADAYEMVVMCAWEDFLATSFEPNGDNVIDHYLKRRGWKESVPGKRYLAALRDSVMSIYEVVDVEPGHNLVLRDLFRPGQDIRVDDKMASEAAVVWDRLGLRLLSVNGRTHISNGVLNLSFDAAEKALQTVQLALGEPGDPDTEAVHEKARVTPLPPGTTVDDLLYQAAPLFSHIWLSDLIERVRAELPQLVNMDGEDIAFSTARFPVEGAASEIAGRLDADDRLRAEDGDESDWTWIRPGDEDTDAAPGSDSADYMILGGVTLGEESVVLFANSVERGERGRAMLAEILDGLVGPPLMAIVDQETLKQDYLTSSDEPAADLQPPSPDVAAGLRESMDRHYGDCLDEPIPMLDELTPRQAVAAEKGRDDVVLWLKYLENQDARHGAADGGAHYDFGWMWEELGIGELRGGQSSVNNPDFRRGVGSRRAWEVGRGRGCRP